MDLSNFLHPEDGLNGIAGRMVFQSIENLPAPGGSIELPKSETRESLLALKAQVVVGAETIPLAAIDQSTKVENLPSVPLAVPESQASASPEVQLTLPLDETTLVENQPMLPLVTPESGKATPPMVVADLQMDRSTLVENAPTVPLINPQAQAQESAIAKKDESKEGAGEPMKIASLDAGQPQ